MKTRAAILDALQNGVLKDYHTFTPVELFGMNFGQLRKAHMLASAEFQLELAQENK